MNYCVQNNSLAPVCYVDKSDYKGLALYLNVNNVLLSELENNEEFKNVLY